MARHTKSLSSPRHRSVKENRANPIKHPGVVRMKRGLFCDGNEVKYVLFMNAHYDLPSKNTGIKTRLPNETWVGLRCPWRSTVCPLCEAHLRSLGLAACTLKRNIQLRNYYIFAPTVEL